MRYNNNDNNTSSSENIIIIIFSHDQLKPINKLCVILLLFNHPTPSKEMKKLQVRRRK